MELQYFEQNILPLKDKLFRIALRITASRPEAEDVVQDVMMKMWQMRGEWDRIANKEAYCCMAARNLALGKTELKDNQRGRADSATLSIKDDATPVQALEGKESMEMLRAFIDKLPPHEKAAMELRDIEGMSYREISETLQINDGQVRVNIHRARQKIKQYFDRAENYGNTATKKSMVWTQG